MDSESIGLECEVLTRGRHPKSIAANYVSSVLVQGLKAHHLILVRGRGDQRRIKAAISHLELANSYTADALRTLRELQSRLPAD